MILEFSVGNFRAIKDIQVFNLTAANIVSSPKILDESNVLGVREGVKVLKNKVIYGPNASGKSSFMAALIAFVSIVENSFKDEEALRYVDSFIFSEETVDAPSFFQIVFSVDGKIYRYGFEADNKRIYSEWLFLVLKTTETALFIREGDEVLKVSKAKFPSGYKFKDLLAKGSGEILTSTSLFLTASSTVIGGVSKGIHQYLRSIIVVHGLGDHMGKRRALESFDSKTVREIMTKMLQLADTGIEDLDVFDPESSEEEMESGSGGGKKSTKDHDRKTFISGRFVYDENLQRTDEKRYLIFDRSESEGTRKMLGLGFIIFEALIERRPLFIDEFDARFHPHLTRKLIKLFNSKTNKGAQFICITHDTGLMAEKILRKDQFCFFEKDKFGRASIKELVEYKGVRNDASFLKDYNNGKYGGIPYLGNFESLDIN